MSADLHCHTKISDGSTGLDDLILLAKRRKLSAIAVTDHDTLAGVTRAKVLGDRHGVKVIPGAEFSCWDAKRGRKVHLLAYLFTYPDRLEGLCKKTGEARKRASLQILSKVQRYYPVTTEMVVRTATGSTNIFKQHIMHTLLNAGYAVSIYGDLYDKLLDPEKGMCYVDMEYPDVFEVLALLQSAGAITVLAHPMYYDNLELLPELAAAGLDGVEVWHPKHSEEDSKKLLELAKKLRLIPTGGSDFHGWYAKEPVHLGEHTTPDECLEAMLALKEKRMKQERKG